LANQTVDNLGNIHLTNEEIYSIQFIYDFLHITPPMSAPEELKTGPDLSSPDSNGFATVNPETLRHVKYKNIFALGDCSNIPTSKTAAAISSESQVLCANLADVIKGGSGEYNGYTSCPLITGYWKGILAEFDYKLTPMETFPVDQSQERAFFAWFKRNVLPPLYWNGLIKGSWNGPSTLRKIFHLGRG
uniref:Pyr_redox_2 domain-containing protein n=1 Tax=Rodentolepis nana TaxID=102285 RepID=A0A0R3TUN3_RODNA